jgi:hypothetical protein
VSVTALGSIGGNEALRGCENFARLGVPGVGARKSFRIIEGGVPSRRVLTNFEFLCGPPPKGTELNFHERREGLPEGRMAPSGHGQL